MKLTDIPLSRVMAKARREGRKTQTRRIVKQVPHWQHCGKDIMDWGLSGCYTDDEGRHWLDIQTEVDDNSHDEIQCPYGKPGDRLRWLTTWSTRKEWDHLKPSRLPKDANWSEHFWSFHDSDTKPEWCGRFRPGRFLPGFLRHLLPVDKVVAVRVERLNEISEEDAVVEGTPCYVCGGPLDGRSESDCHCFHYKAKPTDYRDLWESINGPGSWDRNPWVWVIEFKREVAR